MSGGSYERERARKITWIVAGIFILCVLFLMCDSPLQEENASTQLNSKASKNNPPEKMAGNSSGAEKDKSVVIKKYGGICCPEALFCEWFDSYMREYYATDYGYQKHRFWNAATEAHPGVFLEKYRSYSEDNIVHKRGLDDNEYSTIVIFSGHGLTHSLGSIGYQWAYHSKKREPFYVDSSPSGCTYEPCEGDYCMHLFRNPNCVPQGGDRVLIKMGCSSITEAKCTPGSGETRWVILNSCHGLELSFTDHPFHNVWKMWARPQLNGGYRALLGFSGPVLCKKTHENVGVFLLDQIDGVPMYWTWLDSMRGYVNVETPPQNKWSGKCVVLAKGSSSDEAVDNLFTDTFKKEGAISHIQPDQLGEWYTALAIRHCSPYPPQEKGYYHYEVGEHQVDIYFPEPATASVYSVDNSVSSEVELRLQTFFLSLLFGFPPLDAFSSPLESNEKRSVIKVADGEGELIYYHPSNFWMFVDLKALRGERPYIKITPEIKDRLNEEAKIAALNLIQELQKYAGDPDINQLNLRRDKLIQSEITFVKIFDPDDPSNEEPQYFSWSLGFSFFIRVIRNSISEIGPVGFFEIHLRLEEWNPPDPPVFKPIAVIKKFRKINPEPVTEIELPDLNKLIDLAESVRTGHCYGGCPCHIDLQLGYYEEGVFALQQYLVPTIMIDYVASPPKEGGTEDVDRIVTPLY